MTRKMSRRDFLRTAGIGAAATAVLTGCGPASRYVVREPYTRMPEYTYNGESTYYATTCRECPAGCGTVVRTEQGRALKIEGNPLHPISQGKTCSRGQAALQGLYNPDRIQGPLRQAGRGSGNFSSLSWDEAVKVVQEALSSTPAGQIAFLMGMAPDHLFDLVSQVCLALGAPLPIRYGAHAIYDARQTLFKAAQQLFNAETFPYFDLANAEVTFSFGANFLETYLSPVAFNRSFARMRRGTTGRRGYLVQFEPRLSQTAATADEWIPLTPGTEGLAALALGRLVAEIQGGAIPAVFHGVKLDEAAAATSIPLEELQRLAHIFSNAAQPLAIPGGSALGCSNGLEAAQAVLALNAATGNLGQPGGLFLSSPDPLGAPALPGSMGDVNGLVMNMMQGAVKVLFIHGANPVFELPAVGFTPLLKNVSKVISFASFPDETSQLADYIFPDHTALESWGYQRPACGAEKAVISGAQPVVVPYYDTKATADVLLAAVANTGGDLAKALPYTDEVDFLQNQLTSLVTLAGYFTTPEIKSFMAKFQQFGGWWAALPGLNSPQSGAALSQPVSAEVAHFEGAGDFYLLPFMSPILGDGTGANKPWLQETPDPTTTVMWNTWVEINPESAAVLGLEDDDVVRISSPYAQIELPVYKYPGIRLDTIAIPFGQGHTAYGRYAANRGANPHQLLGLVINGADDLAFLGTRVHLEKTGQKRPLSRLESRMGVYGEQ